MDTDTTPALRCDCKRRGEHDLGTDLIPGTWLTCAFHGKPVTPAITRRHLSLISEAAQTLGQLRYEGSHTYRSDPAPTHGSPWDTPDLPAEVMVALQAAHQALTVLHAAAYQAATADPDRARR